MTGLPERPLSRQPDLDPGPRRAVLILVGSLATFLVLGFAWMSFATLDVSVRAPGTVIPSRKLQLLQSLEGGILRELAVKEGQRVKKGQLLARLENREFDSELGESRQNDYSLRATITRLDAEISGTEPIFTDELKKAAPETVEREKLLWRMRREEQNAANEALRRQIEQRRQELEEAKAKGDSLSQNLELARESLGIERLLFEKGAGARADYIAAQQRVSQTQGELEQARLSQPRLKAAIQESQARLAEIQAKFRAEASTQKSDLRMKLSALQQLMAGKEDRVARHELISPMDGVVNRILLSTLGGIAKAGESIMEIVPEEDTLIIAARVPPKDIAFIHRGQEASVRITAYDYSQYGALAGKVVRVGADAVLDEKHEPYFEVQLETGRNYVGSAKERLPITAGMTTDTAIRTGHRTVLEYLFKPVARTLQRSLEER
ncbi:MAG: HlyD family type I secretion periplasmic adaptor subunit [Rhodocyclaceae bacterium]|nr:HlyD family type I secretion periplasmic adaptor subunit [Rhodocyclaceae bacterium]